MNNYQHHEKAQELADTHSAYELARRVVELEDRSGTLDAICDLLVIGSKARNHSTIMTCIGNIKRFSEMLHAVEQKFFMVPGEADEDCTSEERGEECLVNSWGSTIEQYLEQFERALKVVELESARGEPVGWQFYSNGEWFDGSEVQDTLDEIKDMGRQVRYVYAAPPAPAAWADTYEALGRTDEPSFPAPAAVPEGWRLAPVEPTDEMISAGANASNAFRVDILRSYEAMIASAPQPKETGE